MHSRDEERVEQRRLYAWLGIAAAVHVAVIASVVVLQLLYVRMHPPLKVVNVSLVSMPGRPGPAGGPKSLPATPAAVKEAAGPEPVAVKQVPEAPPAKPEPKVPEPLAVKKIPDKTPVAKAPEPPKKTPETADARKNLQAALENLKKKNKPAPSKTGTSDLSNTLARLQKKVVSEGGGGTGSSGSGSGAGGGRYGVGGEGAFDPYKAEIAGIIQNNWSFSRQMIRSAAGMEVYVSILIMPDGSVSQIRYDRKSTSQYLNSSVQRALEKSAPFPALPGEYGKRGIWVGFVFTPEGIGL